MLEASDTARGRAPTRLLRGHRHALPGVEPRSHPERGPGGGRTTDGSLGRRLPGRSAGRMWRREASRRLLRGAEAHLRRRYGARSRPRPSPPRAARTSTRATSATSGSGWTRAISSPRRWALPPRGLRGDSRLQRQHLGDVLDGEAARLRFGARRRWRATRRGGQDGHRDPPDQEEDRLPRSRTERGARLEGHVQDVPDARGCRGLGAQDARDGRADGTSGRLESPGRPTAIGQLVTATRRLPRTVIQTSGTARKTRWRSPFSRRSRPRRKARAARGSGVR